MPETPGFNFTAEVVCRDIICITVTLLPYWDYNGSKKLTTCKKIKYETAVLNAIVHAVNDYYQ